MREDKGGRETRAPSASQRGRCCAALALLWFGSGGGFCKTCEGSSACDWLALTPPPLDSTGSLLLMNPPERGHKSSPSRGQLAGVNSHACLPWFALSTVVLARLFIHNTVGITSYVVQTAAEKRGRHLLAGTRANAFRVVAWAAGGADRMPERLRATCTIDGRLAAR